MTSDPDPGASLHEAGLRSTAQRRIVLGEINRMGHATAEELARSVQARHPDVNTSTVYRTLDALAAAGLVTHTHLRHGAVTYHSVGGEPHIHLVCARCERIDQVPFGVAQGFVADVATVAGFRIDLTHLAVHGLCQTCAGASAVEA